VTVPGAVFCILIGLLLLKQTPKNNAYQSRAATPSVTLSAPGQALAMGNKLPGTLPATVGPLSDELQRVQRDLARTADFLLATVPWNAGQ